MKPEGYVCRDFGRPGCCGIPDTRYTMRFDDIGEPPIFWCTFCGAKAMAMNALIEKAFNERPGFLEEFRQAIEDKLEKRGSDELK